MRRTALLAETHELEQGYLVGAERVHGVVDLLGEPDERRGRGEFPELKPA